MRAKFIALFVALGIGYLCAQEVRLQWDPNVEPDLRGYYVYRSTRSGEDYDRLNASPVPVPRFTDTGVSYGPTYYYTVSAVNRAGLESGLSNEASINLGFHFPHFVNGDGVFSEIILQNGSQDVAEGRVFMYEPSGDPLAVEINGIREVGEFDFTIPPQGTVTFYSSGRGRLVTGWVLVRSSVVIGGTILFRNVARDLGIRGVYPGTDFLIPVELNRGQGIELAVALVNPNQETGNITFTLLDRLGNEISNGRQTLSMLPQGQLALYLGEIYGNRINTLAAFVGALRVKADQPVSAWAVRTSTGNLATLGITTIE